MDNDKQMQVLTHAQLDLVMYIEYLLGLRDTFSIKSGIETLREIRALTGDSLGIDLLNMEEYKEV